MLSAIIALIEMFVGERSERSGDETFACPHCGYVPEQGTCDMDIAVVAWDCPECGYHMTEPGAVICPRCGDETLPRFIENGECAECRAA